MDTYAEPRADEGKLEAELFQSFPREAAIVLQRGLELSVAFSAALVAHCAALVAWHGPPLAAWATLGLGDDGDAAEVALHWLCLVRVACLVPRPAWWLARRAHFAEARGLPTPQQVTQRLQDIQSCPASAAEVVLRTAYYVWLLLAMVAVCLVQDPSQFTEQVQRHLVLNFASMAVHRLFCILLFVYLARADLERGVSADMLSAQTTCLRYARDGCCTDQLGEYAQDAECTICLSSFVVGDQLRKLGCGHCFHSRCLDPWLLNHRNRCPLCLDLVGVPQ